MPNQLSPSRSLALFFQFFIATWNFTSHSLSVSSMRSPKTRESTDASEMLDSDLAIEPADVDVDEDVEGDARTAMTASLKASIACLSSRAALTSMMSPVFFPGQPALTAEALQ
mmetsp:Transcript_3722/g.9384  ORF Transcript_3722/g.9384 Transcript_3722/m.9384 type:complete len:113 (-) Transcript_3722:197-535(-)|eukprot:CAMPEP_0115363052 /NCGR_PEP_ID=MMETSP0270-20121206/103019_1 /TAXON_ID=71861 /ORGANISM="Scrippsiella trochoidea, Strain CCMP3099" /LENGTH=112 /DNA_ID=CAMNT_0002785637 /DNA_START=23 /DNA_END=361 /DNA_ORIENTATION=+